LGTGDGDNGDDEGAREVHFGWLVDWAWKSGVLDALVAVIKDVSDESDDGYCSGG
jgi:hypothetical protein